LDQERRIVSKSRYVLVTGMKFGAYSVATSVLIVGVIGLSIGVLFASLEIDASRGCVPYLGPGAEGCEPPPGFADYCVPAAILVVSMILICISCASFKYVCLIPSVQPITCLDAQVLPLSETLVRPSNRSLSTQKSELLRVPQGADPQAKDLLTPITNPSNL
jgi:hypothetical protein